MIINDTMLNEMNELLMPLGVSGRVGVLEKIINGSTLEKEIVLGKERFDTVDRENFFNLLGQYFIGENWPLCSDKKEKINDFMERLTTKINEHPCFLIL